MQAPPSGRAPIAYFPTSICPDTSSSAANLHMFDFRIRRPRWPKVRGVWTTHYQCEVVKTTVIGTTNLIINVYIPGLEDDGCLDCSESTKCWIHTIHCAGLPGSPLVQPLCSPLSRHCERTTHTHQADIQNKVGWSSRTKNLFDRTNLHPPWRCEKGCPWAWLPRNAFGWPNNMSQTLQTALPIIIETLSPGAAVTFTTFICRGDGQNKIAEKVAGGLLLCLIHKIHGLPLHGHLNSEILCNPSIRVILSKPTIARTNFIQSILHCNVMKFTFRFPHLTHH